MLAIRARSGMRLTRLTLWVEKLVGGQRQHLADDGAQVLLAQLQFDGAAEVHEESGRRGRGDEFPHR